MANNLPVRFSEEQYRYLLECFPTYVLQPSCTEKEYSFYFGSKAVLEVVRKATYGQPKDNRE